jgi:hypothetical protein
VGGVVLLSPTSSARQAFVTSHYPGAANRKSCQNGKFHHRQDDAERLEDYKTLVAPRSAVHACADISPARNLFASVGGSRALAADAPDRAVAVFSHKQ